ncbi:hypothetical protein DM860_011211 [Cuscuta australis]|uniref:DUF4283 domain-containing protein n=1 Tax=Cuscuta australis TaxID=267555 RepID=A0A328DTU3_9ASTE|nr:hypothetical protein DM860_011211 [Cuscuta australis]
MRHWYVLYLGANPPLEVVKGYINRIWKEFPIKEIFLLKEGQCIVSFKKVEDMDSVLRRKCYYFDNKPILIQKWYPGVEINLENLDDVPIWIQFPDLDMRFWSLSGLSKLVGKPIKRDRPTANKTKYAYSRIQVEVKVQQEFPQLITCVDDEVIVHTQRNIYEWFLCICSHCGKLDHMQENCRISDGRANNVRKKLVWKPKSAAEGKNPIIVNETKKEINEEGKKGKDESSDPEEEGFIEVNGKKVANRKLETDEGDPMAALKKVLEKSPYHGHYPFLT